jgi:glycosyltransferase involved in cell wall biosynthesis
MIEVHVWRVKRLFMADAIRTDAKPRVLHVYKDYYPPVLGGVETTIRLMALGTKSSFDVSVLVNSGTLRTFSETIEQVQVTRVGEFCRAASAPMSPQFLFAIRRACASADLLHMHHPNPTGDAALLLSGFHGPVVMTYHSDVVRQRQLMRLYGPLQERTMRRCDVIMPTSPNYIESSEWLQRHRDRCTVLPLGIDLSRFSMTADVEAAAARVRARYPGPIVIFVGRLRYYKGLHFLVEAMRNVNATLLLGGTGPEQDRLAQQIRDLNLEERVHMLGDLSEEQLVAHLRAADVFCMPSHLRSEAFGLSQIEAMACGLPVVSTDLPTGVPFINRHRETGLIVPPAAPAPLGAAINELLQNEQLRYAMGAQAKTRATTEFGAQRMCSQLMDVYNQVLGR